LRLALGNLQRQRTEGVTARARRSQRARAAPARRSRTRKAHSRGVTSD
jgi:hypothetical protein